MHLLLLTACLDDARRLAVKELSEDYQTAEAADALVPGFDGKDADRDRVDVSMRRIATASQPTDIQFHPVDGRLVVLEKTGALRWFDLDAGTEGTWATLDVVTESEEGLLGLAWHPKFADNGLFYLNSVQKAEGRDFSLVEEWKLEGDTATQQRILMSVLQPYQNHDAGQLQFGPDGMLYIGWGDGGFRNDPKGHGQNADTLLGSMLRVDVTPDGDKQFTVPADNPKLSTEHPEVWAIGLRNPWRYSFAPDGRLVVADVGQDAFEEVSIVGAGDNMGWKIREAAHCFEPSEDCTTEGLVDPIWEYGRDEGQSITGGYVYTGSAIEGLGQRYVFADFVSGRIWALDLDDPSSVATLGRWPFLPSTFGRDGAGELYVASFGDGAIYALE
jgi:glucose/arabinose dehydrogenase